MFICLRPRTPYPPPLYTLYTCTVYSILIHRGKGGRGRVEPERRLERLQFTKLGRKFQHDWLYLQSLNSDKHLPQSPSTGQFFLDDDILLWCLYCKLVHAVRESFYVVSVALQAKAYKLRSVDDKKGELYNLKYTLLSSVSIGKNSCGLLRLFVPMKTIFLVV